MSGWRAPRDGGYHPGGGVPEPSVPPAGPAGTSSRLPAKRPEEASPFEEAAYRAGLAEAFHASWHLARDRWSRAHSAEILQLAMRYGLTGEDVTRQ